jgi:hypothetical protein
MVYTGYIIFDSFAPTINLRKICPFQLRSCNAAFNLSRPSTPEPLVLADIDIMERGGREIFRDSLVEGKG